MEGREGDAGQSQKKGEGRREKVEQGRGPGTLR